MTKWLNLGDTMFPRFLAAFFAAVLLAAIAGPARAQTVDETINLLNGYAGGLDYSEQPFDRVFTYRTSDAPFSGAEFPVLTYGITVISTTLEGSTTQERTITFDVRDIVSGTVRTDGDKPRVDFTCENECFVKAHTTVDADPADPEATGSFSNGRHSFFVEDAELAQRFVRAIEYLKTQAAPADPFATENFNVGAPVPPVVAAAPGVATPAVEVPAAPPPPPPPCFKFVSNSCTAQPYLNGLCKLDDDTETEATWFISAPVLADDTEDSDLSMKFHTEVLLQFGSVLPGTPSACFDTPEAATEALDAKVAEIEGEGTQIMRVYLD